MESIKEQIESHIKLNKMRMTKERKQLIECVACMKEFNIKEILNDAAVMGISKPSVYFFVELLVNIGILKIQERYVWNKEGNKLNL